MCFAYTTTLRFHIIAVTLITIFNNLDRDTVSLLKKALIYMTTQQLGYHDAQLRTLMLNLQRKTLQMIRL